MAEEIQFQSLYFFHDHCGVCIGVLGVTRVLSMFFCMPFVKLCTSLTCSRVNVWARVSMVH